MTDDLSREHDDLVELVGAYVLGGLDSVEREAFSTHLRRCPTCQHETAQYLELPGILDRIDPVGVIDGPEIDLSGQTARLVEAVRAERAAGRHRRRWLVTVAAALIPLAAGAGLLIGRSLAPGETSAAPEQRLVVTPVAAASPHGEIALTRKTWGTEMGVQAAGLPTDGVLSLWVRERDGEDHRVAEWTATPAGRVVLTAPCPYSPEQIATIEVRDAANTPLARTPGPSS